MPATTQLMHVKLPRELHRALRIRAAQDETTVTALVEAAVRRLLGLKKEGGQP